MAKDAAGGLAARNALRGDRYSALDAAWFALLAADGWAR